MAALIGRLEGFARAVIDWGAASPLRGAALVGLIALAVILPGLASLPVTDRDEARFAQSSKQMLETGNVVDIRLQDQPRWKKPVGIYWLQAGSAALFGGGPAAGIWAYRLPSAAGALLAALLTLWAARPLIGPRGAVLAGAMTVTALVAVVEAHIAKTDAALLACAVAALGALGRLMPAPTRDPSAPRSAAPAREARPPRGSPPREIPDRARDGAALQHELGSRAGLGTALVFWLAIAVAILLKGPVVPAIVALALGTLWLAGRRPDWRRLHPAMGLALTALIVAPWVVAIDRVSEGAFFAEALGRDLGGKLVEGQESHWGPPGLYLALVWVTFWPWAALIPAAAAWAWRQRGTGWAVLLAGWVVPFWLVLELVPTKLPHYVLPLYPALAIAVAAWLSADPPPPPRWARQAGAALVALPGLGLVLLVAGLPAVLSWPGALGALLGGRPDPIASRMSWPALALALFAAPAILLAARAALSGRPLAQAAASLVAAMLLYPAALAFALPSLGTAFPSPALAAAIAQYRPCASGPAFSIGYREPSLVFLTETAIRLDDPERAVAALQDDPGALVLVEERWREILGEDAFAGTIVRERLSYFNYNRGWATTAWLLTPDDARWETCAP